MKALFRNNSGTWFSMAKHDFDGQNIVLEVGEEVEHEFPNKEISYYEQFIPLGIEIVILDSSEMEDEVVGGEGIPGKDGKDGVDGATFIPSIDEEGNLSWSNNKGLENPPTINIKGLKGDKGEDGRTPVKGVDYFTQAELDELKYDDSKLFNLIDEEEPHVMHIDAYPTSDFLFACGIPLVIESNEGFKYSEELSEDTVICSYRWAEELKFIPLAPEDAKKTIICGGYGPAKVGVKKHLPCTKIVAKGVTIKGLCGGHYHEGIVGRAEIEVENCEVKQILGAGWCGASAKGVTPRVNIVYDIFVNAKELRGCTLFFGGPQGNGVAETVDLKFENCEVGWLTAGGSNGCTRNAIIEINGGKYTCLQSTNRGLVGNAKWIINEGTVERFYCGGETEDATVTGIIEECEVEFNGGQINNFNKGTNNGVEGEVEVIGVIKGTVVTNGDISMLEKVE